MKKTARGFGIYTAFTDIDGEPVKVIQSSLATARAVRIYTSGFVHEGKVVAGCHLSVSQVRRIVKALQKFIDGE